MKNIKYRSRERVCVRAQQVWLILVGVVMCRTGSIVTITYQDLSEKLGFAQANRLNRELGLIRDYCLANELPPLNSIVVNSRTGEPGFGAKTSPESTARLDQIKVMRINWSAYRVPDFCND